MSKAPTNQQIIPLDLDIYSSEGRDKLKKIISSELEKLDRKQVQNFATRTALRAAWVLERLPVSDKSRLDRFYYYWLRSLTAATTINCVDTEASRSVAYAAVDAAAYAAAADAAADAYYADAAAKYFDQQLLIKQWNHDLSNLAISESVIDTVLWLDEFNIDTPPKLEGLDDFWNQYLFSPALNGDLFKTDGNELFFEGFLAIPEEVFANKSARAMQEFIQEYLQNNGQLESTKNARLILLGNGGSGKTSIVKQLFGDPLKPYEPPTPRIQVRDLLLNNDRTELSIWDFGGQVIMHSTHSFFISSQSTYIIACNQRANEQPDHWLRLLKSRKRKDGAMTVLIVYTHCDTAKKFPDANRAPWRRDKALRRLFGKSFHLSFFNIDLNPAPEEDEHSGFIELKTEITNRAIAESQTPMIGVIHKIK